MHDYVQGGSGFVGDDYRRVAGQGHGDNGALAHPAAELVGVTLHQGRVQAYHAEEAGHPFIGSGGGGFHAVGFDGFDHLLPHLIHRVEGVHRRLEDHGDAPPAIGANLVLGQVKEVPPVHDNPSAGQPRVVGQEAEQAVGDGGFAAAGFAHQSQGLPGGQVKADVLDGLNLAAPGEVAEGQVFDPEDSLRVGSKHGYSGLGMVEVIIPDIRGSYFFREGSDMRWRPCDLEMFNEQRGELQ